ncbi:MAG: carboxypeptidase regulatory-like domain-containing protein [Planctomycetes bacterium]|nr:carboxypeptidase regulatory-like domain-containing protein [Planctomycetota bacterium]
MPPVVLLLAIVIVVAGWLFWLRPGGEPVPNAPTQGAPSVAETAIDSSEDGGVAGDPSVAPAVVEREQVPATTDVIADGKALVRITARDAEGRAQPDVMVTARPQRGSYIFSVVGQGLTDEHGRIEFADLDPGKFYLSSDRHDQKDVEIVAGLNEIDFEVKAGIEVVGRVLDPDGAPVARADVWMQTSSVAWDGARVLGATGDDGAFSLANVAPDCSLGAFAAGFGPSPLLDLEVVDQSAPPAKVELRLVREGGNLTGLVTDGQGAPIRGAQVAVGDQTKRPDWQHNRITEVWGVRTVVTDWSGRYTFAGVPAGSNVVTARAKGFGILRSEATIRSGATTTLDLGLAKCAVVFGTVTDKDGAPEVGARVRVYDREPGTHFVAGGQIDFDLPFGNVEAIADESGRYRVEGVTPGTAWLFAQRRTNGGYGGDSVALRRDTLEIAPGAEVRWDPVIDVGRTVAGVVRYRDGFPIPHLFITLKDERGGAEQTINSDKQGRFRFLCLDDSTYEVRVQPPFDAPRDNTAPRRTGIVPDRELVEFTVEYDKPQKKVPGTVRGRIADAGARIRNPKAATVTIHSDAGWFRPGIALTDGAFVVDEVEPCRFKVVLKEGESVLASTDWFELVAAGDVDIGTLTTEPGGALHVQVSRAKGADDFEPKLYLRRDGDPMSTTIELGRAGEARADNLTPGRYEASCYFKGMQSVKSSVEVRAGATSQLTIALHPGASGKVAVWWPEGQSASKRRGYQVSDASGAVVQEYEGLLYTSPTRPYELHYTLAAGRYHLEFSTDDGLRGELDFEIPADLVAPELRLDLR